MKNWRRKGFLRYYEAEGMEGAQFDEAIEYVTNLITDYQNLQ